MRSVSVVLCTYNGERYIADQLNSVLEQSAAPLEVLISDDRSTDQTLDVVAAVARSSAIPVRIHQNTSQLGFSENFLRACERTVGDLIAFCDQDDIWLPNKLAVQINALDRSGAVMAAHDVFEMNADGSPRPAGRSRTARRERIVVDRTSDPWGNYLGNTLLFERSLLERLPAIERGGDPFSFGAPLSHDRWLYFLGSTFGGIVILPHRLARYRRHALQLYGAGVDRSVRQRLLEKRQSGRRQATALASLAADRASLLERHVAPGRDRNRSISRWKDVHRRFDRSAKLYDASLPARIGGVLAGVARGDYLPVRLGGLGLRRILQDGSVALLIGRRRRDEGL